MLPESPPRYRHSPFSVLEDPELQVLQDKLLNKRGNAHFWYYPKKMHYFLACGCMCVQLSF